MSAAASFEERRIELEALIAESLHGLWEHGLSVTTDSGTALGDQAAFVDSLVAKLEGGGGSLVARTSARTLTAIVIQVAATRLRAVVSLAAGLSATERSSLASLLRLSDRERRTLATILGLPGEQRRELAAVLCLTNLECQALAAFVGDQEPNPSRETASPKPRQPAGRG